MAARDAFSSLPGDHMTEDADGRWIPLGEGVFARRYRELDLTVGLVTGSDSCLVVDTRGDAAQGGELAAAVRELTPLPWAVAITHAHFDHAFGTEAFLPCDVWAHEHCATELAAGGTAARDAWVLRYRQRGEPETANRIAATTIVPPSRIVRDEAVLDLGGRTVRLFHPGPAHSRGDLVVEVPDAGVVFAGDLVEHAPGGSFTAESFGSDTTLDNWPHALTAVGERIVVPGHGEPVGQPFVATQRRLLDELVTLRNALRSGELSSDEVLARSLLPADVTLAALRSG
ncbi:MBL fold metallo-hydrolase [Prauserella marina]|nr:MBL fold metallo-hydrolase [Prauserella marina]